MPPTPNDPNDLSQALRWAMESATDPTMAAADWLARDIDSTRESVIDLLTGPPAPVEALVQAKDAFKLMRVAGETSADRRLGARLYAAAIAAALVEHRRRISRQSNAATRRALDELRHDPVMPDALRRLAEQAHEVLGEEEE